MSRFNTSWIEFFQNQKFTHAVTIKPNYKQSLSLDRLHHLFAQVYIRTQRRALGPRFNSPANRAMQYMAFAIAEGLPHSGHLHAAFKVPNARRKSFEALFDISAVEHKPLSILLPGGTWCVEPIDLSEGWYNYSFKQIWKAEHTDRIQMFPMS